MGEVRRANSIIEKACDVVCQNQELERLVGPDVIGHSRRLTERLLGRTASISRDWLLRVLHVL